ncbi:capsular polysaccharide biosynthesis protein [Seohaeicola sp. SP36]|uniref:capsular polysaccharide biosynthesis protein n=1 Tax=unclassified Seohaeicola TaxID=2641111 RepID=UPI00237AFA72|nr:MULTISPECIES: capsular polysaccharide biosynthesis protein [unclassified Seohaeicola]MDD9707500.1 capsular polysaccharide biosynthesis protein [Seohaeicola sp. 4SK31]MDD9735741.1 capsular polysaccharide biosynthesis protein [Seohaeicola sp. SP36]
MPDRLPETARHDAAGGPTSRRLFYYNAGFLTQPRIRRILDLAGHELRLGVPGPQDRIAVWGHSPYAARGEAMARQTGATLVRIEDAFLRSVHPGRDGEPPLGLVIDSRGMHYDPAQPSDLEVLLATHPLDDTALLDAARGAMARLAEADLSKYNAHDPQAPLPAPGYVLIIDQTRGDAAVTQGRADSNTFREMLFHATQDNPGARIVIKTHPETVAGHRAGYFDADTLALAPGADITLLSAPVSPRALLEGAVAVYTVSSQMGFEAILAGHRPHVFGQPFYAGWGLSEDFTPVTRRQRRLTRAQLFAAAMILYPVWYDPCRDRLCPLDEAISALEAQVRAWREDRHGWQANGMRLWKRGAINGFFGGVTPVRFRDGPARDGRRAMVWAAKADTAPDGAVRVEDGFLRSRGLGADLVPPLSLVCDDLGIYYDPSRDSRLERMIAARAALRPDQAARARALMAALVARGLSKYNLGQDAPDLRALAAGRRVLLVPGQVEDDASIRLGAGDVRTNAALLAAARAGNPDAFVVYKPHPDVEAGLRPGALPEAEGIADLVVTGADPAALMSQVDAVWTMTSLLGFEALIRGRQVVTLGAPFYAGWGLTDHRGPALPRRQAHVTLEGLVHAALIDYPRYRDPVSGLPCPVEVAVERLAAGAVARGGLANRLLAKLQGVFAGHAHLWRRG